MQRQIADEELQNARVVELPETDTEREEREMQQEMVVFVRSGEEMVCAEQKHRRDDEHDAEQKVVHSAEHDGLHDVRASAHEHLAVNAGIIWNEGICFD